MDYRTYIFKEFEQRCKAKAKYSLRQFARDLEIPASRLSEIFNSRRECSLQNASQIIRNVDWQEQDKRRFLALVTLQSKRQSRARKELAANALKACDSESDFKDLSNDTVASMSEWYYNAIIEMTYLDDFRYDINWIAKKLGINSFIVELTINRLLRLKQLRLDGERLVANEDFTQYAGDIPSEAIRRYHLQVLDVARRSITDLPISKRDLSAITFAAPVSEMPRFKQEIKIFRQRLAKIASESKKRKDQVMTLSLQLVNLCQEEHEVSA